MPQDLSPLWISIKVALVATLFTFAIGITAAYAMLSYRGKWKSLIEGIIIAPMVFPPTVVGFLLLLLCGKNGVLGQLLERFHINIVFTWYAGVIAATVVSFPLMYKAALGAFEQVDRNLIKAARTLGANEFTVFWRIAIPLALPGILAGTVLAFARALGEFGATLMLAGNIPGLTQTMPIAIYFAVEAGAMQEAWFWSLMIIGISLLGLILINFWDRSKVIKTPKISKAQSLRILSRGESPIHLTDRLIVDIQKQYSSFYLDVSFSTSTRSLGVLGASGAGKSLILRCIAGLETPDRGKIILNGRTLFDSEQKINLLSRDRNVGFLFQNYALFPHLTVAQNIAFGLPKGLSAAQIQQKVEAQLRSISLLELRDRYPSQLSGGQQQRVALARTSIGQPDILLLDEPFSALDTHLRSQMERELIATLQNYEGVTLFVSHNIEEAYRICDDLLILDRGQIIAHDRKAIVLDHPITSIAARLTGCKNFSHASQVNSNTILAVDWDCQLQVDLAIPDHPFQVGIRAHHLIFATDRSKPNTFPCWLVQTSETPHRLTLYLKLNSPPTFDRDYHIQAEIFKEKWLVMQQNPLPWLVQLDPARLLLVKSDSD